MKYVIVGAGGVGGCVGGYLAEAGQEVTLIARGEHLNAIRERGLRVDTPGGSLTPRVDACTMEEYRDRADVIFVCVKYYSLKEATDFVKRVADRDTVVIPLLNVFGTGEEMQAQLPGITVTDGCVYIYSFISQPGVVAKPSDIFKIYFGLRQGQETHLTDKLRQVEADLKAAGITATFTEDIRVEAFRKFTYVSPIGAAGLLCNACAGDFLQPGEARDTVTGMMQELLALGNAMGITYKEDMVKVNLDILATLEPDAQTSMQRDVYAGRQSEAEGLIGWVARSGKDYGVPMPLYDRAAKLYN